MKKQLEAHVAQLYKCKKCPDMIGPVVSGKPVITKIMFVGQAPGDKEGDFGKPFAWTAGKTLFKWFTPKTKVNNPDSVKDTEDWIRNNIYFAAVCRCFPGKNPKGGDRVPNPEEIKNCSSWMEAEIKLLKPKLIVPIGKLGISQFIEADLLKEIIGKKFNIKKYGVEFDMIPLPHPSGASTWHRMEPGKTLTEKALKLVKSHAAFKALPPTAAASSSSSS